MKYIITVGIIYWINLLAAAVVHADFVYDLQATLEPNSVIMIDQAPHFYDMFHIYADGTATVTFENDNASLTSPTDLQGEYSDPYLYLYILDTFSFPGVNGFSASYVLADEDDDGNSDVGEGLYFYLEEFSFTDDVIAMVTSYDPLAIGTVDFNIYSNEELNIQNIPEPMATTLVLTGASILILMRKQKVT